MALLENKKGHMKPACKPIIVSVKAPFAKLANSSHKRWTQDIGEETGEETGRWASNVSNRIAAQPPWVLALGGLTVLVVMFGVGSAIAAIEAALNIKSPPPPLPPLPPSPKPPPPPQDRDVRLSEYPEGRLDMYLDGNWYAVCGHYFWGTRASISATVACRKMGYRVGSITSAKGKGPISDNNFILIGSCDAAESIDNCTRNCNPYCIGCDCTGARGSYCMNTCAGRENDYYCTGLGKTGYARLGVVVNCSL